MTLPGVHADDPFPDDKAEECYLYGPKSYWTRKEERPSVHIEPANFAHGVWEALAVTLAEPIRKALEEHNKTCTARSIHDCQTCRELLDMLPRGEVVWLA